MSFEKIDICQLSDSFTKMIRDDWALLTAGDKDSFNTMTVSWGASGELWGKDVAIVFVRPQRYTYEFMEKSDTFTLSFFGSEHKKALSFCGSKSGRDVDKAAECGFSPVTLDGSTAFDEAQTVIVCKKIAFQDMDPAGFLSDEINNNYAKNDYHRIYVGEILGTYKKV
ncbi:MAG: flavin reductase family protein [Clostridia bacterium]|nr:flavin reductase family protein [Clostridia bacterium]